MPSINPPSFLEYLAAHPTLSVRVAVRRYPRFYARCCRVARAAWERAA
jgi:hypothetical protein